MKKLTLLSAAAAFCIGAASQNAAIATLPSPEPEGETASWYKSINIHGFAMMGLQTVRQGGESNGSFDISMARLSADGVIQAKGAGEFFWKTQVQVNGNVTSLGSSARLVDLFATWRKYDWLRVTVGEFSMPFTIENDYHPLDVGFADNAVPILKLAGYSDRSGKRSSNGRDIGVYADGDILKMSDGHALLHYGIAVMNGQGINTKDVDDNKTVAGIFWVSPFDGLRIGVSGLEGSLAREGEVTDNEGREQTVVRSLYQHRYALSAEWATDVITARAEYIHSTGSGFAERDNGETGDLALSAYGDKADGFYAMVVAPILTGRLPGRLRVKARYDMYRPSASMADAQSTLQIGADYWFTPKIGTAVEYSHANDRSLATHNYNYYDFQVQIRF